MTLTLPRKYITPACYMKLLSYRVGADRIYIEVCPSVEVRTSIEVCCASIEDEVRLQATASLWRHRP